MNKNISIVETTKFFVQRTLQNAEGGHDWQHINRVYKNAMKIAEQEICNKEIVALAALLHDIADSKFHNGDEEIGAKTAEKFLKENNVNEDIVNAVVQIIKNVSFKGGKEKRSYSTVELDIVQDADRLDALGAIGIARAFNYGGFKNREIFNPDIPPDLNMDKEAYKKSTAPTINHFYEKLLLLKDLMNTETGKQLAEERHEFMKLYLRHFFEEVGEKAFEI
ncbi:phosphohydrolase [Arachidicoccus ginsenosidimutans]|uniref:HD domain-containing protein n=1 Tax=Arachidicoccus sp. BS20 TaxID=1850526 RepID=UPI0007F0CD6B|nr:HD domain-containing protein [Arachidicoccus sp. BS20]ANI88774.1 phosphohydrolase [Arachidicoccus sp. BS20]